MNFENIYRLAKLREANINKLASLLDQLGLPKPTTKDEIIAYAAALSAFGKMQGDIENSNEDEILEGLMSVYGDRLLEATRTTKEPGLFSKGEEEYYETYVDNSHNKSLGRAGKEYGHQKYATPSKAGEVLNTVADATLGKLFANPAIAAAILTLIVGAGIGIGSHLLNNKDYEKYHDCENAICQTYENENDGTKSENGARYVTRTINGKTTIHKKSNPEWDRQQSAIRQYHNSGHSPDGKFDANGIFPGMGSKKKGGGSNLYQYIYDHAQKGFHNTPAAPTPRGHN